MDVLDTILRTLSAIVHLFYYLFIIIFVVLSIAFAESKGDSSVKARVFRGFYFTYPFVMIALYYYV